MCRQPRIVHPLHRWVGRKDLRQPGSVGAVTLQPQRQRAYAPQRQPCVESAERASHQARHQPQAGQEVCPRRHHSRREVPMPAEVLGRAVHHRICPVLQGPAQVRRGKGAVNHQARPCAVRHLRQGREICHAHQRVADRLHKEHRRPGVLECIANRVKVGCVNQPHRHALGSEHVGQQPMRRSVQVTTGDDTARVAHLRCLEHGVHRRHAGRKRERTISALQVRHGLGEEPGCGPAVPRVDVPARWIVERAVQRAEVVEVEPGRGLDPRRYRRAQPLRTWLMGVLEWARVASAADGAGLEAPVFHRADATSVGPPIPSASARSAPAPACRSRRSAGRRPGWPSRPS
jgi:hypothetical protein